ncbi:myosin-binding protein 7-like isoform X2 [Hordeum vulgare subsp. vulgare]|uniref:myosin-binding protein 7-like isoform X2 n=1 Tax=Hordeum vulgare subsp. vulgare TaxID=112509 RepID=UPI001D1A3F0A|nr:myosin-binding protein 7-like isoform X2 [Hordeum vulgare subsp. vulgare]
MAELQEELEAERGAAAEAASEAMSMILRLQRDKSEAMMEARQFRRFAEERFAHDAAEVAALHVAMAQRDASIQSLSAQLRVCRSRLIQLGFVSPSSLPSYPTAAAGDHLFADDCPSIQCLDYPARSDVGSPRTHHLFYTMPGRASHKGVICASPRRQCHGRALSNDSLYDGGISAADELPFVVERDVSDQDNDCDPVYTVEAVHRVPVAAPEDCCYFQTPMGNDVGFGGVGVWAEEQEIQKLSARLQALEADRESMRHAIMSMGAEKAQVVMLKDIAHQLCEEASPLPAVSLKLHPVPQAVVGPQRKVVKRQPFCIKFFIVTVIKQNAGISFIGREQHVQIRGESHEEREERKLKTREGKNFMGRREFIYLMVAPRRVASCNRPLAPAVLDASRVLIGLMIDGTGKVLFLKIL